MYRLQQRTQYETIPYPLPPKKNQITKGHYHLIIYSITASVVVAPQMISLPVLSIFSLFSNALWDLPNSRPVHSLMLSSYIFLWFWPDLMNGRYAHITAVCVSLRSSVKPVDRKETRKIRTLINEQKSNGSTVSQIKS